MEKEKYPPNKKESVKGLFARIKGLTIIAAIILALWSFSGTSCIFRSIIGLPLSCLRHDESNYRSYEGKCFLGF